MSTFTDAENCEEGREEDDGEASEETRKTGTLFVVATPIGNMEDITLRAMRILNHSERIVCEDTRVAKKLLFKYEIEGKTLLSISQHAPEDKLRRIVEWVVDEGKSVAMVCDAGTPGLSDPGNAVVEAVAAAGGQVSPVPGASALTAIVSVAGINMQEFLFKGFPPHKKGRQTYFTEVLHATVPVIYYDSPHRVVKNLELLQELLKNEVTQEEQTGGMYEQREKKRRKEGRMGEQKEKRVIVGRELTKMFEEVIRGTVSEVLIYYQTHPEKVKGEFVVLVY